MLARELVTALILITSAEQPEITQPSESLLAYCSTILIKLEVMDQRESGYNFRSPLQFKDEIVYFRKRYEELLPYPPLSDSFDRFPDRSTISDMLVFNRCYRQRLDSLLQIDLVRTQQIISAIEETDRLYGIWDAVRDCQCEYYYVHIRRQALDRLRRSLGEDSYHRGFLPPHVPLYAFVNID